LKQEQEVMHEDSANPPDRRAKLLALLDQAGATLANWAADLPREEIEAEGQPERWSAKAALAHIAYWHGTLAQTLDLHARGEAAPDAWQDEDRQNAALFEQSRDKSWVSAQAESRQALAALRAQVARLDPADLEAIDDFAWREDLPLWQTIAGNGYRHPLDHLVDFAIQRGRPDRGVALMESIAAALLSLDTGPAWRGHNLYNVACACALAGRPAPALDHLRQALALAPNLTARAPDDPHPATLHDDPAWRTLIAEA
jgi:hypothetical protein